jgi:hypothetical protein
MDDMPAKRSNNNDRGGISRRKLLWVLGVAVAGVPFATSAFG